MSGLRSFCFIVVGAMSAHRVIVAGEEQEAAEILCDFLTDQAWNTIENSLESPKVAATRALMEYEPSRN